MEPPFPPLVPLDFPAGITEQSLLVRVRRRLDEGVSICVLSPTEVESRGGYFFHFRASGDEIELFDFRKNSLLKLPSVGSLVAFINHCSGVQFDEQCWAQSREVNLRADGER